MSRARFRLVLSAAAAGVLLAGCQSWLKPHKPAPPVEPAPIFKPTPAPVLTPPKPPPPPPPPPPPKSCVPRSLGPPPRYPDTNAALRAAPGAADRYQLMAAGRLLREERLEELERVIAGCR
jgi:hypothetical protein